MTLNWQSESSSNKYYNSLEGNKDSWWKCHWCCNCREKYSPTNETLLSTAFLSFLSFTILQFFAALWAESEAMLADTAAMAVDACTYALNLVAERLKPRASLKQRLQLEFATPFFSVIALAGVNVFFVRKAARVVTQHPYIDPEDEPKAKVMLIFSLLNLCLDAVNVTCFARAQKLMGFEVPVIETTTDFSSVPQCVGSGNTDGSEFTDHDINGKVKEADFGKQANVAFSANNNSDMIQYEGNGFEDHGVDADAQSDTCDDSANLNMCSAYTHVFADTLRSVAVVSASCIAEFVNGVESNQADAIATLIVSFLIFLSLLPLMKGLFFTWLKLREAIHEEQVAEFEFVISKHSLEEESRGIEMS
mmetsp:Transcript_26326/g.37726  ORF Transcript_26326/g.37726 Transcript_26326/m.37726 type:complete len:363 (-) Transcript_26326:223-1311(-)